jgi:hypothetical protein
MRRMKPSAHAQEQATRARAPASGGHVADGDHASTHAAAGGASEARRMKPRLMHASSSRLRELKHRPRMATPRTASTQACTLLRMWRLEDETNEAIGRIGYASSSASLEWPRCRRRPRRLARCCRRRQRPRSSSGRRRRAASTSSGDSMAREGAQRRATNQGPHPSVRRRRRAASASSSVIAERGSSGIPAARAGALAVSRHRAWLV